MAAGVAKVAAATLCFAVASFAAQPSGVPARNQAVLMLRVLLYDRNLRERAPDDVARVVVVTKSGDSASAAAGHELTEVLGELSRKAVLGGRKIRVREVTSDELDRTLDAEPTCAVYLSANAATPEVLASARRHRALTFSADPSDAAVGFVQRSDRVVITVNLKGAKAEGADLDSELLALAEVR